MQIEHSHAQEKRAEDAVQSLAATEEDLRVERERLDWLEHELDENRYHEDIVLQSDEEDGVWFAKFYRTATGTLHGTPYDHTDSKTQTVRAAIDAARSQKGGPDAKR